MNRDREALLAAIARAGGSGVVNAAEVKQGAIDAAGRVAWIETDVARLRVAGGGRILFDRNLNRQDESNWGYEGCSVPYLEWWGDRLVAIATEERVTAVWSVGAGGDHEARPIPGRWAVDGDVVAWVSEDYPGLLCGMAIPSLESLLPLPRRFVSRRVRLTCENGKAVLSPDRNEGGEIESLRLPAAAQRSSPSGGEAFLESVFARLDPETGADESLRMLVEAAARPFCEDDTRRPVPFWMPVYWHRHLAATGRGSDADRHLARLDATAAPLAQAEPETGWEPGRSREDGALALAVRYVRRQARVQAAACRAGELPQGWWCLLFEPAPRSSVAGSRVDAGTLTPALRRAFEVLAPTRPAQIPHRY